MNDLQNRIQDLVNDLAQDQIDLNGITVASFQIEYISQDKLSIISDLLIQEEGDDYSFLCETPEFGACISAAINESEFADEELIDLIKAYTATHNIKAIERLVNYRINELRESHFSERGCVSRIDSETGETIWSKK